MDYRNKLITGLSLVALAAFTACTDETENGGRTLPGDHSLSFTVSTAGTNGWKPANGTRAASGFGAATREFEPVEMQGKVDGKAVYLTTEVMEGFPDDNTPMTRGTQINKDEQDKIENFGVSAYTNKGGKPDYMYNEVATKDGSLWFPKEKYYWPTGKTLSFYAWYPCTADGMILTDETHEGAPVMTYTIPKEVTDQIDVMTVAAIDKNDPNSTTIGTELTFDHALSAVKFAVGDELPECTVESIAIRSVKYKGSYTLGTDAWDLQDDVRDFSVAIDKETDGTGGVPLTGDDQTFFMMPQKLPDDAKIEVALKLNDGTELFLSAFVGGTEWMKGYTYTYRLSYVYGFELDLVKDVFIASGKDAVVYVKANCDWTVELVEDYDNAQNDMITFEAGQKGVKDDTGSNENAKLVFKTNYFSTLETVKKEVKVKFTPTHDLIPITKTITFWKGLEAPTSSGIYYEVSNAQMKNLLQITNLEGCPENFVLPSAEIGKVISEKNTDKNIAYEKSYPVLDRTSSTGVNYYSAQLSNITIMTAGGSPTNGSVWHPLNARAKYPFYKNGNQTEESGLTLGTLQVRMYISSGEWNWCGVFIYTDNGKDNLLKDKSYIGVRSYSNSSGMCNLYAAGGDQTWTIWNVLNFTDQRNHKNAGGYNSISFNDNMGWYGSSDRSILYGKYSDLTGANIISPELQTYYVRRLTEAE